MHVNLMNTGIFKWVNKHNEVMLTESGSALLPGEFVFKLKDTHGLPLDFICSTVLGRGILIEWPSYIEQARIQGRYDYQTYQDLLYLYTELSEYRDYFTQVIQRFKLYVMTYPMP